MFRGDGVLLTAPSSELKLAKRELGTVKIDPAKHPHLDHGYALTNHSSQGQTADRVLIHIDTELAAKDLLNNRMAYVAVSRGARDAQIFTSDREKLPQALSRDVSQQSAHPPELGPEAAMQQKKSVESNEKGYTAAEHERHQAPIQEALEPEDAAQFKWIAETGNIQSYQHTETGRNIHINGKTAQFYSQEGKPTSQEAALDRAIPEGRAHSQNEYEQGLGIGR